MNNPTKEISIIWNDEDIKAYAADMDFPRKLTSEEIGRILDALYRNHDAETGISWDTIDYQICRIFDER